ncbi:MAG TPA: AAA family ATPase, partial [Candidatus Angelobacter sp.]
MGHVITFYSYKGGTGRSMAVANVACVLASRGARVLAIDWDLEAPGLHRFFAPPADDRRDPGLIDLLYLLREAARIRPGPPDDENAVGDALKRVTWRDHVSPTLIPGLFILRAGLLDEDYGAKVRR